MEYATDSSDSGSKAPSAFFVCALVFLIYNSNLRLIRIDDSIPARLLPFSLLLQGNLYLDGWVDPYLPGARGPLGVYFVVRAHNHWMSVYPPIMPIAVTPLYIAPALWVSRQQPPLVHGDIIFEAVIDIMEKLSASLIATLSVGILYLALRKVTSPLSSLGIALVYGLASTTWTISSQALWRQGFAELSLALLLWALVRDRNLPSSAFWAGLALGMSAANRPASAVIGLAAFLYFARQRRNTLFMFCAPMVLIGSLVLFHNLYFFGRLIGPDPNPFVPVGISSQVDLSHSTVWHGLIGMLLSPNRGLLIYMPWIIFALWGAARLWKDDTFDWGRYIIVGVAVSLLSHARYWGWWGGWCFGPRYLTDLLPILAFFLVPIWPRIQSASLLRWTFALSVAAALSVEGVGAFCYNGFWDARPVSVDRDTRRLWDWRDTQISRSLKSGPAPPTLYYELYLLFTQTSVDPRSTKHSADVQNLHTSLLNLGAPTSESMSFCCFTAPRLPVD